MKSLRTIIALLVIAPLILSGCKKSKFSKLKQEGVQPERSSSHEGSSQSSPSESGVSHGSSSSPSPSGGTPSYSATPTPPPTPEAPTPREEFDSLANAAQNMPSLANGSVIVTPAGSENPSSTPSVASSLDPTNTSEALPTIVTRPAFVYDPVPPQGTPTGFNFNNTHFSIADPNKDPFRLTK